MKIFNMKWFASAAVLGTALLSGCDIPPQETVQRGYRGTEWRRFTAPKHCRTWLMPIRCRQPFLL